MSQANWSLRRRLLVWLLAPLVLLSALMLVQAFYSAREAADKAYDRLLLASALAIADRVVVENGELDVDLPYVALEMLSTTAQDRVFYRVVGPGDAFITGYSDLPSLPDGVAPADGAPVFFDATYRGDRVRIAALAQPVTTAEVSGRYLVQVAQTRGERDRLTRELVLGSASQLLLLLAVVVLVSWLAIRRGLAPLARLQGAIMARSPDDLRPLDQEVPKEVRHLVGAINDLLGRLGATLGGMQRFIADASHQLRTPLAALQTQTEVALREPDPGAVREALERLQQSTRRTSRLANQLLSLARATPQPPHAHSPVDLARLAKSVATDAASTAVERDIDLGFELDQGPHRVVGDEVLLGELMRNLVDNALRYCPAGARVTVRVRRGEAICFEVEDDGPGVPPSERERVFERFYRTPGSAADGCGLGLAIVREIAQSHGGTVELCDGRDGDGLLVRVALAPA